MTAIEDILYGNADSEARLPLPNELVEIFKSASSSESPSTSESTSESESESDSSASSESAAG